MHRKILVLTTLLFFTTPHILGMEINEETRKKHAQCPNPKGCVNILYYLGTFNGLCDLSTYSWLQANCKVEYYSTDPDATIKVYKHLEEENKWVETYHGPAKDEPKSATSEETQDPATDEK